MKTVNKILLLTLLLVGTLLAKEPATMHFCVSSFDETADDFDLGIRAIKRNNPNSKWKWPDSLTCGHPVWKNKFVLNFEGRQIEMGGEYDGNPDRFSCKVCSDTERLQKRSVTSPFVDELSAREGGCLCRNEKPIDSTTVKKLYGKKFKADWETTLSCSCPSYQSITLKTKLNVVIDGPCASVEVAFKKTETESMEDDILGEDSAVTVWESSGESCSSEEPKEDTVLAEGVFPCYYDNANEKHHPVESYGSTKRMNMADKPEASEESLECFEVDGKRYLVFGSNVPNQFYSEHIYYDKYEYITSFCYESINGFKEMKKRETPFYSCEKEMSSPKGCRAKEHGLDFVMNGKGEFSGWDRKALWLYARLREAKDAVSFMDSLKYSELEKEILLPANISKKTVQKLGDEAARKTAGMAFYKGTRRVRYEKFGKNQLNSMKDALDKCNAWGAR